MPFEINGTKDKITVDRFLHWSLLSAFFLIPLAKSPAIIAGVASIVVWVVSGKCLRDRALWLKEDWLIPVALFMLLPWVGLLWTADPHKGLEFAGKSYYWLYAFVIATLPQFSPVAYLYSFIYGLSLNSIIAILYFIGLIPLKKVSATGLLTGFNPYISYSLLLVFGILILSFLYRKSGSWRGRALLLAMMAIYTVNLAIIKGRIGYIAFAVLLPLMLYNIFGRHLLKVLMLQAALVAALLVSPVVQQRIRDTVKEVTLYRQDEVRSDTGLRLFIWGAALQVIRDHPVVGVGTGGFENELKKRGDAAYAFDQPHNSFLYMMASFGITGLVSIIWLFAAFFMKGWKARGGLAGFSVVAFGLVLVIGSLTDTQVLSRLTAMMFALLMGMRLTNGDEDGGETPSLGGDNYKR